MSCCHMRNEFCIKHSHLLEFRPKQHETLWCLLQLGAYNGDTPVHSDNYDFTKYSQHLPPDWVRGACLPIRLDLCNIQDTPPLLLLPLRCDEETPLQYQQPICTDGYLDHYHSTSPSLVLYIRGCHQYGH